MNTVKSNSFENAFSLGVFFHVSAVALLRKKCSSACTGARKGTVDSFSECMTKNYMRPKQVAEWLNISLRQVKNWQAEGVIPYIKVGGTVLFEPARVQEALQRFERNSGPKRKVKIGTDKVSVEYEEPVR